MYLREQMELGFVALYPTYRMSGMPIAVFNQLMECLLHCAPPERINWHFPFLLTYRSAGAGSGRGNLAPTGWSRFGDRSYRRRNPCPYGGGERSVS